MNREGPRLMYWPGPSALLTRHANPLDCSDEVDMARLQMFGMKKSQGGGCRVTLMEGGEPVVSCWAPTFPEAGQALARLDDIRRASMTAEQRRAHHDAATHATRAR